MLRVSAARPSSWLWLERWAPPETDKVSVLSAALTQMHRAGYCVVAAQTRCLHSTPRTPSCILLDAVRRPAVPCPDSTARLPACCCCTQPWLAMPTSQAEVLRLCENATTVVVFANISEADHFMVNIWVDGLEVMRFFSHITLDSVQRLAGLLQGRLGGSNRRSSTVPQRRTPPMLLPPFPSPALFWCPCTKVPTHPPATRHPLPTSTGLCPAPGPLLGAAFARQGHPRCSSVGSATACACVQAHVPGHQLLPPPLGLPVCTVPGPCTHSKMLPGHHSWVRRTIPLCCSPPQHV